MAFTPDEIATLVKVFQGQRMDQQRLNTIILKLILRLTRDLANVRSALLDKGLLTDDEIRAVQVEAEAATAVDEALEHLRRDQPADDPLSREIEEFIRDRENGPPMNL